MKTGAATVDDSLISSAVRYYSVNDDPSRFGKSLYYDASLAHSAGDAADSASFKLTALGRLAMNGRDYSGAGRLLSEAAVRAASVQDSINVAVVAIDLYGSTGDTWALMRELRNALRLQDEAISAAMNQSVAVAQRNALSTESELNEERSSRSRLIILLALSFSLVVIALLVVVYIYRMKLRRKESEAQEKRIADLGEELVRLREKGDREGLL